jgi:hypothetical protein
VQITCKILGLDSMMKSFQEEAEAAKKAMASTLNKVTAQAKTAAVRSITEKYNIKKRDLENTSTNRTRINIVAARRDRLTAILQISGKPISLAYFGAKQTVGNRVITRTKGYTTKRAAKFQGVTVEILRGKKTKMGNSFIAAVRAGNSGFHTGVFTRAGKGRLPILERKMVTIPTLFSSSSTQGAIQKVIKEKYPEILRHEWDYYRSRMSR